MSNTDINFLLQQLLKLPKESEWLEFKHNFHSLEEIGELLSALSNGACLNNKKHGYLIFGIENNTHKIIGTDFKPTQHKKGNEEIIHWLAQRLNPRVDFVVHEFEAEGKQVAIFEIEATRNQPVDFMHKAYIRVGSITRLLREFPEKERKIWNRQPPSIFEKEIALSGLSADEVIALIDTQSVFELLKLPYPTNRESVLEKLNSEKLIEHNQRFAITNLGAILFAKNLSSFPLLSRKAPRVVVYKGKNKIDTLKDQTGVKGYAAAFEPLVNYINDQLPTNEAIESAIRKTVRVYPDLAVRELVANALIHQDFSLTGTVPLIEIFSDRIEITNPGLPLITTIRFIDEYQSRNETLAALMRRMGICEEKGSGIDKVVSLSEIFQLPAPDFITKEKHTTVVLYAPKSLNAMDKNDRVRSCYQHCCLKYVSNEKMTNQSLRNRFKIDEKNAATASRIIKETMGEGLIKDEDPNSKSRKYTGYIPFWA